MKLARLSLLLGLALAGCNASGTATVGPLLPGAGASPQASAPASARPSAPPASTSPTASPKPAASPAALPSPWPSGFPAKNPSPWPTTLPGGAFNFDGVWAEAPADKPGLKTMPACEGTYQRYAFQDPGKDGKDVLMSLELYSPTILRFGPTTGQFIGNLEAGAWVFRGQITAPGPADAPETKPWIFKLTPQADRILAGVAARTDEEAAASERDVRLVPVDGGPCPTPRP